MANLAGKTVLITGALGTIGKALVARYHEAGATVIASDRPHMENASETIGKIARDVRYFGCDLSDLAGTEKAVTALAEEVGGIDILVNNAAFVVNKPHEQFTIEEYENEVRINSSAAFVVARACSAMMKQKKYGKIVNMTSATLTGHWEGFVPYVASKGAMYGLIKALARELGHYGINVNGVSPGAVVSEAEWRHFGEKREEYHRWILERQSLKRRIEPEDIANLVVFLSSPEADLITGQDIHCDGGW
ncbi:MULTISPECIES: SDR family oxidoreductase [Mesorhizobium]|uniref:SDR family oxidoreductase n=1 Tax=Mesorhizobium TaxID=68287 RepID=UPI0009FEAA80|nr:MULTISPECIES: SDR family oxidoreductase [Mesorhizobium]WJI38822.1 SDR family oxidoreductase [Mesorhizobium opportunistum]